MKTLNEKHKADSVTNETEIQPRMPFEKKYPVLI